MSFDNQQWRAYREANRAVAPGIRQMSIWCRHPIKKIILKDNYGFTRRKKVLSTPKKDKIVWNLGAMRGTPPFPPLPCLWPLRLPVPSGTLVLQSHWVRSWKSTFGCCSSGLIHAWMFTQPPFPIDPPVEDWKSNLLWQWRKFWRIRRNVALVRNSLAIRDNNYPADQVTFRR